MKTKPLQANFSCGFLEGYVPPALKHAGTGTIEPWLAARSVVTPDDDTVWFVEKTTTAGLYTQDRKNILFNPADVVFGPAEKVAYRFTARVAVFNDAAAAKEFRKALRRELKAAGLSALREGALLNIDGKLQNKGFQIK